jgi:Fe-S oxidoreductase
LSEKSRQKKIDIEDVLNLPLETKSQEEAKDKKLISVTEGRLKVYDSSLNNVDRFLELLSERINRHLVSSMVGCVHCGMCAESCHYVLTRPDDPTMTPVYKADQIRRIFKRHMDWTGRIFPWWVHAGTPKHDEDLNRLKNIVFGTCSACRRCTMNCPMGVDTALLIRLARGILTELGIVPEGVFNVSRDTWETGNHIDIPVDNEGCDFMYTINPREIKFDPRSIADAAKIFHFAGESWTMPSWGWDQTNFGLYSGDDKMGAFVAKNLYEAAVKLRAKRIVISECGHGYRSSRWEGYNWAEYDQNIPNESVILTLMRYIREERIKVDESKNQEPVTFHDSCNVARSGDLVEEPRWILERTCSDFREMSPNRTENFCCTGGSGLLSMAEYKPLRMEVAELKAKQLKDTGAKLVCTICHNCVDGLTDVIKHYELDMRVVQIIELVANALIIEK